MENAGKFYGSLEYFTVIWYTLWQFDIFSLVLVHCVKKNLATLEQTFLYVKILTEYRLKWSLGQNF
jgi:hypothetical protein